MDVAMNSWTTVSALDDPPTTPTLLRPTSTRNCQILRGRLASEYGSPNRRSGELFLGGQRRARITSTEFS
jgi:hypothetical protein